MASVYKKGNKIYITWYDALEGKNKNKSLGLDYSKGNLKKAKSMAKEFQKKLNERDQKIKSMNLNRKSISLAFEHFLKNNSNKHPKTIEEYNWFYAKFITWFNEDENCTKLTKLSCEEWLISLRKSKYQQNTLFKLSKVLKKFLRFLFEYQYTPMFMLNSDITFKREVKPLIIFSVDDLKLMISELEFKNSNFKTLFYLLLFSGLRPSDIINLGAEDIDTKDFTIAYYSSKTKNYSIIPVHPRLMDVLKERISIVENGRLFEYENINNIGKAVRRYFKDLGLETRSYNLRTFRKTFISIAHASGMDLATVSKLVGHSQITTTEKYYNKLSLAKKQEELDKLDMPVKENTISYLTEGETEGDIESNVTKLDEMQLENN